MAYCEDYPCCGHDMVNDPCDRQWYDEPDAFDPRKNPHCFCEHEFGICEAEDDYSDSDEDEAEDDDYFMREDAALDSVWEMA